MMRERGELGRGAREGLDTYLDGHDGGNVLDEPRDREDHIRRISVLLHGTVDLYENGQTVVKKEKG